MKRVACIWFPNWPLQRLHAVRPEARSARVLLFAVERGRQTVVARSPELAREGIAPGTSVADARTLCGDDLLVLPHDPAADATALEALARWCHRFSPIVGTHGSDVLLLDVTGCDHLHGGELAMAETIHRTLADRGLRTRIALADTIGTAWAVARWDGFSTRPSSGINATPRSTAARPNGRIENPSHACRVVPPGGNRDTLLPLPVESLRLETPIVNALHELGVKTVARLERLPRSTLPARFGPLVAQRLDEAFGRRPETFTPVPPLERLRAARPFEPPLRDAGLVERVLATQLDDLLEKLRTRREGVLRLRVRLDFEEGEPAELEIGCVRSIDSSDRLRKLLSLRLERTELPAPVERVELEVAQRGPIGWRRATLFGDDADDRREVDDLVERLSQRLGDASVAFPQLVADAQPEHAFRFTPVLAAERTATPKRTAIVEAEGFPPPAPSTRPSTLLRRPEPIEVDAPSPESPPTRFHWRGRGYDVHRTWGPERIVTGWWRGPSVRRDYHAVETTTGHRFWLFHDRSTRTWFVHGAFD